MYSVAPFSGGNFTALEIRGSGGNRFEGTVGVPELIGTVVEDCPAGYRKEFSLRIHVGQKNQLGPCTIGPYFCGLQRPQPL